MPGAISVPQEAVADICRRYRVRRLSLFGSVLRDDFGPDSDVDMLVEFEPGEGVGYITFGGIELQLSEVLGAKVDLNTPGMLNSRFRDEVLREAEPVYVAP